MSLTETQIRQLIETEETDIEFVVGSIITSFEPGMSSREKPCITFYNPRDLYTTAFVQQLMQGSNKLNAIHASDFLQTPIDNLITTEYSNSKDMIAFVRQITKRGEVTDTFKASSEYWSHAFIVKGIKFLLLNSEDNYAVVCGLADFEYIPAIFPDFSFKRATIKDRPYVPEPQPNED